MKNIKKIFALVLCLAMLLSLSACSLFDNSLVKAIKATSELESLHADISATGILSANLESTNFETKSYDVDFTADGSADILCSPFAFRLDAAVSENSLLPSSVLPAVTVYGEQADNALLIYYGVKEQYKGYSLSFSGSGLSTKSILKLASAGSKLFSKSGTETLSGKDAIRYDGTLTQDTLKSLLSLAGVSGVDVKGDIPMSIWIDAESFLVLRIDMDLSGVCESISEKISDVAEVNLGEHGMRFGFSVSDLKLSIDFSQFNGVSQLEVPEVIANAKETA